MGKSRHHTIMGIGAIELPDELRSTLVDARAPVQPEDTSGYRGWIGRIIDRKYELVALIAEGGMGAVFEARDVQGGAPAAFKVMHAELGADDAIVQRFAREVEIGRQLKHENVVAALDTGATDDGWPYLVLELVTGPTLSHAMWTDGAFEWRRAVRIGAQVAAAIAASWEQGFVHRDLKPDNVVLQPDGRGGETVKLLDFGIAHDRSVTGVNAKLTIAGEVLGTIGYMSPEQTVGQGVDVRSDLYALGVLLWEMLAGYPLFDEDLDKRDYLLQQMRLTPIAPTELSPGAPAALDELVLGLLAHLSADRPSDPGEVHATLLRLLEPAAEAPTPSANGQVAPAGRAGPTGDAPMSAPSAGAPATAEGAPAPTATHPTAPEPGETAPPPRASSSTTLILLTAIGLGLIGALTCVIAGVLLFLR